jgi:hypothetical protein
MTPKEQIKIMQEKFNRSMEMSSKISTELFAGKDLMEAAVTIEILRRFVENQMPGISGTAKQIVDVHSLGDLTKAEIIEVDITHPGSPVVN